MTKTITQCSTRKYHFLKEFLLVSLANNQHVKGYKEIGLELRKSITRTSVCISYVRVNSTEFEYLRLLYSS